MPRLGARHTHAKRCDLPEVPYTVAVYEAFVDEALAPVRVYIVLLRLRSEHQPLAGHEKQRCSVA